MWLRSSRVATRIWCTESHSSRRTFGSYSSSLSRLSFRASITAKAGESSSSSASTWNGGSGAADRESPRAATSLDGDVDIRAPAFSSREVADFNTAAPVVLPVASPASSISHSRHEVRSPPGSRDQAVT